VGVDVLGWVIGHQDALMHPVPGGVPDQIRAIRLVADPSEATPAEIERIRGLLCDRARDAAERAWMERVSVEEAVEMASYDLDTLLSAGILLDGSDCPMDSLFAEWGYLIDLDASTFEVYRGFQETAHSAGRFALRPSVRPQYYPVALVAVWPLANLPNRNAFLTLPGAY
jgi:hypothetical protein